MVKITWDHLHLRTADPEGMVKWFEEMLGAEITRSTQQGKSRIDMKVGGANIFIYQMGPNDKVNATPDAPNMGIDHFGLAVSDIDEIAAHLKSKGVTFTKEPHSPRPGVKICFIRGPENISIELLDRNPKWT